jgi:hypothetical protein
MSGLIRGNDLKAEQEFLRGRSQRMKVAVFYSRGSMLKLFEKSV